jgi:hypothetical protein
MRARGGCLQECMMVCFFYVFIRQQDVIGAACRTRPEVLIGKIVQTKHHLSFVDRSQEGKKLRDLLKRNPIFLQVSISTSPAPAVPPDPASVSLKEDMF